jgi:hypothetical protein
MRAGGVGRGGRSGRDLDAAVQELRSKIGSARPDERVELGMSTEKLEERHVLERLHDGALPGGGEINFAGRTVARLESAARRRGRERAGFSDVGLQRGKGRSLTRFFANSSAAEPGVRHAHLIRPNSNAVSAPTLRMAKNNRPKSACTSDSE